MKKNTIYVLLGLAAMGGVVWYMMKNKKKKKGVAKAASYLSKNIVNPQIGSFPDMC